MRGGGGGRVEDIQWTTKHAVHGLSLQTVTWKSEFSAWLVRHRAG